jgi:hypothetical protein
VWTDTEKERILEPHEFRKIRALDQASLYARQAKVLVQEAYARDPNSARRDKLDAVLISLQEYEDTTVAATNEAYEQLSFDQP